MHELLPHVAFESLQRHRVRTESVMEQRIQYVGILAAWIGFFCVVTWLDWFGLIPFLMFLFGRIVALLIVIGLLIALRAVLRSAHMARLQRAVVAIGIVWLLALPFIPWRTDKVLIVEYFLLVPGMTTTQVQTIMSAFRGIHDMSNAGRVFCGDRDWKNRECAFGGTALYVEMANDRLISAEIYWD